MYIIRIKYVYNTCKYVPIATLKVDFQANKYDN